MLFGVAKYDGLERLSSQVGKNFSLIFTLLACLLISPGLGIPREVSVPFEMAVVPYLPHRVNVSVCMVIYSLIFFLIALWLCLNLGKPLEHIGHFLIIALLFMLCFVFSVFSRSILVLVYLIIVFSFLVCNLRLTQF